jgi:hypothetical protein
MPRPKGSKNKTTETTGETTSEKTSMSILTKTESSVLKLILRKETLGKKIAKLESAKNELVTVTKELETLGIKS